MKITAFDDLFPNRPNVGGSVAYISSGSNSADGDTSGGGDVTGDPGDYAVVGLRRTVSLASNIGGGTVGDVLTIIQASPRLAAFATPSNSGGSFGSNATRVSEVASGGASSSSARADHIHDGIGTITASSSNTLQRGTFNLRAGNNVSIGYTDSDGDGELDTATIHATGGGGGAGGSGAPTTAPYVTTAADSGLSAEVVIPGLAVPDRVPASPSAYDDEFSAALSGWTAINSPDTSEANGTGFASMYHMTKASVSAYVYGIYKAAPSMPFTVTAKLADGRLVENYAHYCVGVAEATPGKLLITGPAWDGGAGIISRHLWASTTSRTSFSNYAWPNAYGYVYLRMIVTSSTDIVCQASRDGLIWITTHGSTNPSFTVGSVVLVGDSVATGITLDMAFDWIRFT